MLLLQVQYLILLPFQTLSYRLRFGGILSLVGMGPFFNHQLMVEQHGKTLVHLVILETGSQTTLSTVTLVDNRKVGLVEIHLETVQVDG
jgi:hypothetical protein